MFGEFENLHFQLNCCIGVRQKPSLRSQIAGRDCGEGKHFYLEYYGGATFVKDHYLGWILFPSSRTRSCCNECNGLNYWSLHM